jgi:hypothetical protein
MSDRRGVDEGQTRGRYGSSKQLDSSAPLIRWVIDENFRIHVELSNYRMRDVPSSSSPACIGKLFSSSCWEVHQLVAAWWRDLHRDLRTCRERERERERERDTHGNGDLQRDAGQVEASRSLPWSACNIDNNNHQIHLSSLPPFGSVE